MKNPKTRLRILVLSGIEEVLNRIDTLFIYKDVQDIFQGYELCVTYKRVNYKINGKESHFDIIFWPEIKKTIENFISRTDKIKHELYHDNRYDIVLFGPVIERNLPEDYHSYELQFDKFKKENENVHFVSLFTPKCKHEENLYNKYGVKVIGELNWGNFEKNLTELLKQEMSNFRKKELVNSN